MNPKRVALYCRVSTSQQTTENQILDLRRFCQHRGWTIVAECVDHGVSGAKDNRPALKEVMELARKRRIEILLVHRFDRFARSVRHLINTLEELRILGVSFISFSENMDTCSPQGALLFNIVAAIAEFERSLITERIHAGLRRARSQGKRLGRQPLALDIVKLRQMRQEGQSLREIATKMRIGKSTVAKALKPLSVKPDQNPGGRPDGAAA